MNNPYRTAMRHACASQRIRHLAAHGMREQAINESERLKEEFQIELLPVDISQSAHDAGELFEPAEDLRKEIR